MAKIQRVTGTQDVLPDDRRYWDWVTTTAAELAGGYGFQPLDVPILEYTELFGGDILSLSFEVKVHESAPVGWFIENIATITAFTSWQNPSKTILAIVEAVAPTTKVVPEPTTLLLMGLGLGILALLRRRR